MAFIIDASITLSWCFEDERTPETDALFVQLANGATAVVPNIWPFEVTNVMTLALKKGRINQSTSDEFLKFLKNANITIEKFNMDSVFGAILSTALKFGLTSYDAAYIELASRLNLPLATLDKPMRKAALAAGVTLLP